MILKVLGVHKRVNRGTLMWRPPEPLCAVSVKTASVCLRASMRLCCYLCLLDGALRCGTL